MEGLKATEYNQAYYEEHRAAGLDYLGHGYWQQSYARMIAQATLQAEEPEAVFFDAGCACGSILQGFKSTGIFHLVYGMDRSEYMVEIGREHFGFVRFEIVAGDIACTAFEEETVSLIHCAQVLEHVPADHMGRVVGEFARILQPGGRAFICLDAIKHGETAEKYSSDPTHVNLQPTAYWTRLFEQAGLLFDREAYDRFVRSALGPTRGDPRTWFQSYPDWSVWTLIKP